jgi:hypothetical protein
VRLKSKERAKARKEGKSKSKERKEETLFNSSFINSKDVEENYVTKIQKAVGDHKKSCH